MIHLGSREIEEDETFKPAETDHFQIGVDKKNQIPFLRDLRASA